MYAIKPMPPGLALLLGLIATGAHATTFTVSNTFDAGPGSLREAILGANAQQVTGGTACAPHDIVFAIPGTGPFTIRPNSALPRFDIGIRVDGFTQPGSSQNTLLQGSNAQLLIELDGSLAGTADAFVIGASIPGSALCSGTGSRFSGLVINRFGGAAIAMGQAACPAAQTCAVGAVRLRGNYIGTDVTGTVALGNGAGTGRAALHFGDFSTANLVGDEVPSEGGPSTLTGAARNVIAGNFGDGIFIGGSVPLAQATVHRVRNNYIGLGADGITALPNAGRGITVRGSASSISIHENLISANLGDGVAMLDSVGRNCSFDGNGIGIGVGGVARGNLGHGMRISGGARGVGIVRRYPFVLSTLAASIANNAGTGILVEGSAQVDFVAGSVSDNGGLEIDLAPLGVTPNDAGDGDSGPNELLNAPIVDSADFDAGTGTGTIIGSLSAAPSSSYEVYFYLDDACDSSGHGGGMTPLNLGQTPVIVNLATDSAGNASFNRQVQFLPPGQFLSALARRFAIEPGVPALIVSEFSACRQITPLPPLIFSDGFE